MMTNALDEPVFPEYEVQYSRDLIQWRPLGGRVRGIEGRSGSSLELSLPEEQGPVFYRVSADPAAPGANELGEGGAEVFGYNAQLQEELGQLGFLSVADFETNFPTVPYLPGLTWDATTAQFWTNFDSPRLFYAAYGWYSGSSPIAYNFQPDPVERAMLMTNGFVVSERMGSVTFGDAYYRIFQADLPVFITTDSILHAWHRSYDSMLSEIEELSLATLLERVLTNMSAQLPQTWQQYGAGPLRESILDADFFLTVARSLWAGQQVPNSIDVQGQSQRVADALAAVSNLKLAEVPMFGTDRVVDFSQFTVRGHYAASERLTRYFRAMMWCQQIDLRLATFDPNKEDDIRQLGAAVVLQHLLTSSGELADSSMIDRITGLFVGMTDSMTFPELNGLLAGANIQSPADVPDLATLTNLQTHLLTGELGLQNIESGVFFSPLSPAQVKLPRSFTVIGQKFVMDSWALTQVVFDRVLWDPSDPRTLFGKVIRRKPSCLDFAFSVLGNDATVPEIVARILNTNGVPFRDGLPYQHNLLAVRDTLQGQNPSIWTDNIYTAWLAALRALSAPTVGPQYPEAMRTRAWAMKTLNTQLASWTELRHDTVLYAKQGSTPPALCGYPAGFVEPRPEFWEKMWELAEITASGVSQLPLEGEITLPSHLDTSLLTFDLGQVKTNELDFLNAFANQMLLLRDMSERELAQQPFTAEETNAVQDVVERALDYMGVRHWTGWYPAMYYRNSFNGVRDGDWNSYPMWPHGFPLAAECDTRDVLVADVHTDPPDEVTGDPGAVINEAVGNVNMMLIAVNNGPDRGIYAGPVLSHYEFEMPGVNRLSDADWKTMFESDSKPPPPDWTDSFLVPGSIEIPSGY